MKKKLQSSNVLSDFAQVFGSLLLIIILSLLANNAKSQNNSIDNKLIIEKGQFLPATNVLRTEKSYGNSKRSIIYEEDFESNGNGWSLSGNWSIGAPTTGPNSGYNSYNCVATNLHGNYTNNANDWLISPPISLGSAEEIKLKFWEWFILESSYDYGRVKISINDGESWEQLALSNGISNWREREIDLTSYTNETILIAFNLTSDASITKDGWYIDNVIIETSEPEPLTATMVSLNSQDFPFVYMNVIVDSFGISTPSLNQSNFLIYENETLQTDYFEVTPPELSGGTRLADIVFIMDNSGSMEEEQNSIENNVIDFINNLESLGVDFALGLCRFGQDNNNGNPIIEDNGILTSDANYFKYNVWQRNVIDGSDEPGYYAIVQSSSSFSFRPGAQKIIIIITDETPDQGGATQQNAQNVCVNNSITLFALTESNLFDEFTPITNVTNGACFDIYSNFDNILDLISTQVANTYIVRYQSNNPAFDGLLRNVEVLVSYLGEEATATGSYIPGDTPLIERTSETKDLHNQAWVENTEFTIVCEITDEIEPYTQNATLFFKNTNNTTYSSINMYYSKESDIWEGVIPGNYVLSPGVDYYITASDGQSTSSDPSIHPSINPYQLAILPNEAPEIIHNPIETLNPGNAINIQANITDFTNGIEYVGLYFRKFGQLNFQELELTNSTSTTYEGEIPESYVTNDGVEYYLWAKDDYNVGSYHGTPDDPHLILCEIDFTTYLLEKQGLINDIMSYDRPFPSLFPNPIFYEVETDANIFLNQVIEDNNAEDVDPLDLEGVARLALSERVTLEAVDGVHNISEYGGKGAKSILFNLILGNVAKKVGHLIKKIPLIGNVLSKKMFNVSDKMHHALWKYHAIFHNGISSNGHDLLLSQSTVAHEWATTALTEVEGEIGKEIEEKSISAIPGLISGFENLMEDGLFIWPHEMITQNKQEETLEKAINHNFNPNDFRLAQTKTNQKLYGLRYMNNIASSAGKFIDTIRMISEWTALIGILIIVLGAIAAAIFGVGLPAAIAGLAVLLIKAGSLFSLNAAIVESAAAWIYVDGIVPFVYLNPSADQAFNPGEKIFNYEDYNKLETATYRQAESTQDLLNYLSRFKETILNEDPSWATTGIDSLEYYENIANNNFYLLTAKFLSASDSARKVISYYDTLVNLFLLNGAAYEFYSASLEITSGVYLTGYEEPDVIQNSIDAVDSAILCNTRILNIQININNLLDVYDIPTPASVGIGEINVTQIYPTKKLMAEVVNYSNNNVQSIPVRLNIIDDGTTIYNPEKQISLLGGETQYIEFEFVTLPQDTIITGNVSVLSSIEENQAYFAMPAKTFTLVFNESLLGINNHKKNDDIKVYPNPANNTITIAASDYTYIEEIIIYDVLGNNVYTKNMMASCESTVVLNIQDLKVGLYIIKILVDGKIVIRKFIVK